jgi:hypothetical protein
MIIKEESIINKVTEKDLSEKELLFLNAIQHTTEMIYVSYSRLINTLADINIQFRHEIVMADSWSIIDSFNRLKILLDKIIGVKKNLPWFQQFHRKIKIVGDVRDFLQHYDERIDYLVETNKPIMGYLLFLELISENKIGCQLLYPGRIKVGELKMINHVGKQFRYNIDHITFLIGDHEVNISELYYSLLEFIVELENYILLKVKNAI